MYNLKPKENEKNMDAYGVPLHIAYDLGAGQKDNYGKSPSGRSGNASKTGTCLFERMVGIS